MSISKLGNLLKSVSMGSGTIHSSKLFGEDILYKHKPHIKTFNMYESEVDLLALSVRFMRYRTDASNGPRTHIENLLSSELFNLLKEEDIQEANRIRDYYSKKLMLLTLKTDRPMTKFRQDLAEFVNGDGKRFREETLPLAFRLPEFYQYDIKFDEVVRDSKESYNLDKNQYRLLNILHRVNKRLKRIEYWFVDNKGKLACYSMTHDNTLAPIWDKYINSTNGVVTMEPVKYSKNRDGIAYWDLTRLA